MDNNIDVLQSIIHSDLEKIKSMKIGSPERAAAIEDVERLLKIVLENDKNSNMTFDIDVKNADGEAKLKLAQEELELKKDELKMKQDANAQDFTLKQDELKMKQNASAQEAALKMTELHEKSEDRRVEKRKIWVNFAERIAGVVISCMPVVFVTWATQKGWFIDKYPISLGPKPKI